MPVLQTKAPEVKKALYFSDITLQAKCLVSAAGFLFTTLGNFIPLHIRALKDYFFLLYLALQEVRYLYRLVLVTRCTSICMFCNLNRHNQ